MRKMRQNKIIEPKNSRYVLGRMKSALKTLRLFYFLCLYSNFYIGIAYHKL